jgi:hypothetical protein
MSDCEAVKDKWASMICHMISKHKRKSSAACRGKTDKELLDLLMNFFCDQMYSYKMCGWPVYRPRPSGRLE